MTFKTTTVWKVEGPTEEKVSELVHLVPDHSEEFSFTLPAMRFIMLRWTLLHIMREGHTGIPMVPIATRPSGESMTVIFAKFNWPTKARVKAPTEEMTRLIASGLTQLEETWTDEVGPEFAAVVPPFDPSKIRVEMRSAVERVDVTSFGESSRISAFREEEITVSYQDNGVQLIGRYRVSPLMLSESQNQRLPIEEILRLLTADLRKKWNERFGLTKDEVLASGLLKGGLMDKGALAKSMIVSNGGDIDIRWSRDELLKLKEREKNLLKRSALPKWKDIDAHVKVGSTEMVAKQLESMDSKTEKTLEAIRKMSHAAMMSNTEIRRLIGTLNSDDLEVLGHGLKHRGPGDQ